MIQVERHRGARAAKLEGLVERGVFFAVAPGHGRGRAVGPGAHQPGLRRKEFELLVALGEFVPAHIEVTGRAAEFEAALERLELVGTQKALRNLAGRVGPSRLEFRPRFGGRRQGGEQRLPPLLLPVERIVVVVVTAPAVAVVAVAAESPHLTGHERVFVRHEVGEVATSVRATRLIEKALREHFIVIESPAKAVDINCPSANAAVRAIARCKRKRGLPSRELGETILTRHLAARLPSPLPDQCALVLAYFGLLSVFRRIERVRVAVAAVPQEFSARFAEPAIDGETQSLGIIKRVNVQSTASSAA